MVVCVPEGGPGQKMEAQDARTARPRQKNLQNSDLQSWGEHFAHAAAFGVQLAGLDQLFQVFRRDVIERFHLGQRQFQVFGGDGLAVDRRVIGRNPGHRFAGTLGVANAGQVVICLLYTSDAADE